MAGTRPGATIDKATRRIAAGAYAKAVELLVAAWRRHRSDRLAALVERTGELAGERLLRVGASIAEVAALPADPRFASELVADLARPRALMQFGHLPWLEVLEVLVAQRDPRAFDLFARFGSSTRFGRWSGDRLRCDRPAAVPEIEAACEACEAALALAAGARGQGDARGAALLAAIHADPTDLAARAIYADWLGGQGDPRGELITLQLLPSHTDAQRARVHQLLTKHRDALLGDLVDACVANVWFEGGFVAGATIDAAQARARIGSPAWSTLTTIMLQPHDGVPVDVLAHPAMVALEFVGGIGANAWRALRIAHEPWVIGGLGLQLQRAPSYAEHREILAVTEQFALRELGFDRVRPDGLGWLWESEVGRKLLRLRVEAGLPGIHDWIAAMPPTIAAIELASHARATGWTTEISRGAGGRFARYAIVHRAGTADETAPIAPLLQLAETTPPGAIESFALRLAGSRIGPAELARLATAIARRHPGAQLALP